MTKDDVFKKVFRVGSNSSNWSHGCYHETLKCMDEYAKQEAIEFGKWIANDPLKIISFCLSEEKGKANIEELYNLYQQSKTQTK